MLPSSHSSLLGQSVWPWQTPIAYYKWINETTVKCFTKEWVIMVLQQLHDVMIEMNTSKKQKIKLFCEINDTTPMAHRVKVPIPWPQVPALYSQTRVQCEFLSPTRYNCIAVRNKSCIWNTKHVFPFHFCLILSITFMLQRWGYTVYCRVGPNMAHNRTMLSVLAGDEAREAYGKIQVYIYHIKAKSSTWCCINLTGQIYKLWVTIS